MSNTAQAAQVHDLRPALLLLEARPGHLFRTKTPVDPNAELAGVYRHVGAGATEERPTKIGPTMLFESVKGHAGGRVIAGLLASRKRTALLMGVPPEKLAAQSGGGPSR